MGRVSMSTLLYMCCLTIAQFAMCMSSIWQMCDASCLGPVLCTDNSPCRDDQACLPSRDGTQTICRLCNCKGKDQCRTDPISGDVTCDCSNSGLGGPFCTCKKCSGSCPPGFTLFDITCTCYAAFTDSGEWATVNEKCHNMSAFLVKITSDAENTFVRDLMTSSLVHGNSAYVWLGGNDIATEGDWIWDMDSTQIIPTYSNWGANPDNHNNNQHCLEMFVTTGGSNSGFWNDELCALHGSYICEYYP